MLSGNTPIELTDDQIKRITKRLIEVIGKDNPDLAEELAKMSPEDAFETLKAAAAQATSQRE